MSRVLLDENVPVGLRPLLSGHDVFTVGFQNWNGLANGRLLDAAEAAHFDVFITVDQNLRFQQRVAGRALAIIVLSSTKWCDVKSGAPAIRVAIDQADAGAVISVQVPTTNDREESR